MSRTKGGNKKASALVPCQCSVCELVTLARPGRHRKCTRKKATHQVEWVSRETKATLVRDEGGGPAGVWFELTED